MTTSTKTPPRQRLPIGALLGPILVWAPAVALVTIRTVWRNVPGQVPAHWSGIGAADSFQSSTALFWLSLLPAVGCGVVAIVVLIFVGADMRCRTAALTHGVLALIASAISLQWAVDVLTALQASSGGHNGIGPPFLLYLLALLWGVVVFVVTTFGSWTREQSDDPDPDDTTAEPSPVHQFTDEGA